jgi:signal transduction histidine kinase/ligand-binding sensor domain-containing protein/CheY-like chemotaxis protein
MAYPVRFRTALLPLALYVFGVPGAFHGTARAAESFQGPVVKLPVIDKQDIRFTHVLPDGAAFQSGIVSIAQDTYGFLWLASHGLYRHDGYGAKLYRHVAANPASLGDDAVSVLLRDRTGILWVGTTFGGLDRLDPGQDSFTHYRHQPGDDRSLGDDHIVCLFQDRAGMLWIGSNGGLDRLDPASGTFIHYRHNPGDASSLSTDHIGSLFEDRAGNLWVGTTSGLNKLDRSTGRFSHFLPDPVDPASVGHNHVSSILEDHSGVLWVGIGSWLSSFDVKTGKFTHYSFHSEEPGSQAVTGVTSIYEDRDGVLWLGTVESGLLKFDRERKRFIRYMRDPGNPHSLASNRIPTVFEDAEGVMWVGTGTGLSRFLRNQPFVNYQHEAGNPKSLPDNPVQSVMADSKGFLWIAGMDKLSRLDQGTGQVAVYRHNLKDPYSAPASTIWGMGEDRSGTLWFGAYGGGLNRFNRDTGRFFAYRHDQKRRDSLSSDLVLSLLADHRGTLWVGTQGGGLNRFDQATGHFTTWRNDPQDPHSLSHDNVIAICEDRAGYLWLGTLDGLSRFDQQTGQFVVYRHISQDSHSLSHNKVNAIREDKNGVLWIGTDDGLSRMDRDRASFTTFTEKDGLPDNRIGAILEDGQGFLWVATTNGLSRFNPGTGVFRNYSESDGLPSNLIDSGSFQTQSGELIFGTSNGVTTFYPDRLSTNPYVPPVELTGFNLFNRPVQVGPESPLHKPIWATHSLTLTHDQSIFTLEFAGLSYEAPEKNQYRYRLQGLEPEWNEVDSRRRLATYTSLPVGKYVFRVQASNNDGVWNEAGTALAITVLPAWWATWWFNSIATVSVSGIVFAAYWSRLKSLRLAGAKLEAQVAERTGEFLIAKDAAEAANRAKTTFLSNMSHELRTPLNGVLGFSHLLREEAVSDKQREYLDIINQSGERLLNLIDEVLDVAKIEAGHVVLEIAPCDLTSLVREVVNLMRVRAEAKSLALLVAQSALFPRYVRADALKLRQVLINLLGNAIKYTERGSVTLRLDARPADNSGHLLMFFVEDTGIGIAEQEREHIFEAFVQIGKQTAQRGTGLGLTITRQFVALMGGSIDVESTLGEGSRFGVKVRVERAQESDVVGEGAHGGRIIGLEAGEPERRILIIEDQRENRMLLERLLLNAGFQVRVAHDGPQGVELFQAWHPHFIWVDLRMPVMDGVTVARHIRGLDGGREVKIAAVTASVFADQRREVLAAGLDDFVRKPYRPQDIFDCLARHLGVRYHRGEVALMPSGEPALALRLEALAALPENLRTELRNAVLTLSVESIARTIVRVSELDSTLGSALARRADHFAYTEIFQAIENSQAKSAGEGL